MSYFIAGILRIILLEASVAALVIERVIAPSADVLRRRLRWAMATIAALSVVAFCNFGDCHGDKRLVHSWEQYHFFLGSKYLHELGYFDIYAATLEVDRERTHALDDVAITRDLHTFEPMRVDPTKSVRARFSDARWAAFSDDWATLSNAPAPWESVLADHGNSGSPAWAFVALPFVRIFGCSPTGMWLLATLDLVLMVVMFGFLARTFGSSATAVGLVIWCLAPFCFDFLGGSILRWDWLFALGMAIGFMKRNRPAIAGAFLGYAIISKLFPIFFALAIGVRYAVDAIRRRTIDPALVRLVAGATASIVGFVLASAIAFGGFSIWGEYRERIGVAQHEKYYPNQYSLETVYLQFAESTPHNLAHNLIKPAEIKQARSDVAVGDHVIGLTIVRIVFTLLVLLVIVRLEPLEAFAAGPFLIFIWLTVNAYYWNMLGLSALLLADQQCRTRRISFALIALHVMWASYYLYQHLTWQFAEGYFVSLMLIATLAAWVVQSRLR